MTTIKPSDTIATISPTMQGVYTMKGPEEVLTMKTLHPKGYLPWQIAGILGWSHHKVSRDNVRAQLPNLLAAAADAELNLRDFLIMLCRHERDGKRRQQLVRHVQQARFPMLRTLDDFEFKAQPSVNPDQIHDLATVRWIASGENVLLLGPPGVGKTHLAIGLGRAAADCSVLFVAAQSLMVQLHQAHETGAWDACLTRFVKPKLLIVDEFGYLPVPPRTAPLLFQLVTARYETGGILLTSNQGLADLGMRARRRHVSDSVGGIGDSRPTPTPQPSDHHPRRQVSATEKTAGRDDEQTCSKYERGLNIMIDLFTGHAGKGLRATPSVLFPYQGYVKYPSLDPAVSMSFDRQFRCRVTDALPGPTRSTSVRPSPTQLPLTLCANAINSQR